MTDANIKVVDGTEQYGIMIDIDSIRNIVPVAFDEFTGWFEPEHES